MSAPVDVLRHWEIIRGYTRSHSSHLWPAIEVVDGWMNLAAENWQPVPLMMPMTTRGELFCVADAFNPNFVWLHMRGINSYERLLLPENVRLCVSTERVART